MIYGRILAFTKLKAYGDASDLLISRRRPECTHRFVETYEIIALTPESKSFDVTPVGLNNVVIRSESRYGTWSENQQLRELTCLVHAHSSGYLNEICMA